MNITIFYLIFATAFGQSALNQSRTGWKDGKCRIAMATSDAFNGSRPYWVHFRLGTYQLFSLQRLINKFQIRLKLSEKKISFISAILTFFIFQKKK